MSERALTWVMIVLMLLGGVTAFLAGSHAMVNQDRREAAAEASIRDAEILGRSMAHQGAEADANPFEASSPESTAWAKGWSEARKLSEQWERQLDAGEAPTVPLN